MNLMLDIAASLYEVKNFSDMEKIIIQIVDNLAPQNLISGKIGIYNEEIDEYNVYYHLMEDEEKWKYHSERVKIVNATCKYSEIKYFSRIVADTRKKLVFQDNHSKESLEIDPEQAKFPSHAMLWVPLLNKDKFLGIISFASKLVGSFTNDIVEAIEALGKIISIKVNDILTTERLYKSEKKYRTLVEYADDAIVLTAFNGKVLFRNNAYYTMLGYEFGEEIENEGIKRLHPDDAPRFKKTLRSIIEKNSIREEYRIKNKNGEWVSQEAKIVLIRDEKNQPEAYLSIIRDMRETKKSEEMLRTSEERFHNLSLMVREGIMIHENGIILDANQAFADLTGYSSPQDLIGKNGAEVIKFKPESREIILDHIRSGKDITYDIEIIKQDGKIIPLETSGRGIIYKGHKARLVYMRDITERKRAEKSLRESEKKYRNLIEQTTDGVFVLDLKGNFIDVNTGACNMIGYSREELLSMNVRDIIIPDDMNVLKTIYNKLVLGENVLADRGLRHKNGKYIHTDISARIIENDKICAFIRDITERRKAEKEHLRLQNLESLGVLAGGIAHDFNNILSVILGRASIAIQRIPEEKIMNDLSAIEKAAKNAISLTKQLLTFAKGGEPEKCIINIKKIIRDTTGFSLSGSNVVSVFNLKDSSNIEADPGQIAQVIQNLVINAKQAMPDGGMINLSTEDYEDSFGNLFVKITIADQGTGISKEEINKIFDPYFTTKHTGSGLGLSVCHSIITRHKGYINVQSEYGKGTIFTIFLPATKTKTLQKKEIQKIVTRKLNVLIMDDEAEIRDLLCNMLIDLGHTVSSSNDGMEAIEKYKEARKLGNGFDLVFMDLTVRGGMGGKEAVTQLRKFDNDAKVIVSSGYANSSIATYKEDGFDAVLKKPYTIEDLNTVIFDVFKK